MNKKTHYNNALWSNICQDYILEKDAKFDELIGDYIYNDEYKDKNPHKLIKKIQTRSKLGLPINKPKSPGRKKSAKYPPLSRYGIDTISLTRNQNNPDIGYHYNQNNGRVEENVPETNASDNSFFDRYFTISNNNNNNRSDQNTNADTNNNTSNEEIQEDRQGEENDQTPTTVSSFDSQRMINYIRESISYIPNNKPKKAKTDKEWEQYCENKWNKLMLQNKKK